MKGKKGMKGLCLMGSLLLAVISGMKVQAEEAAYTNQVEMVFAIDCSKSMEQIDDSFLICDFVEGITAAVPKQCSIGAVAYGNEVKTIVPVGSSPVEIKYGLQDMEYKGYGNAGAGLVEAARLFRDEGTEKRIVLISDGELLMKTAEETEQAAELFRDAVKEAAANDIVIDIITFGEKIDEGYTVYSAAEKTGGRIYTLENAETLPAFAGTYLFEECRMKSCSMGQLKGTEGEIDIDLPDCLMDKAKIILTGKQDSENAIVQCEAEKMRVDSGEGFTVVTLEQPASEKVTIHMTSKEEMDVHCYLTAEYTIMARSGHEYIQETGTARLYLDIVNKRGESLIRGHLGKSSFPLYVNGNTSEYQMSGQGVATELQMEESSEVMLQAELEEAYGNYYGESAAIEMVPVPVVEEPPDYRPLYVILGLSVMVMVVLLCLGIRKRKANVIYMAQPAWKEQPKKIETKAFEYTGKLNMYIVQTKDGRDVPPQMFRLFGHKSSRMTLEWILNACRIRLGKIGEEDIIFYPGPDKALIVMDQSEHCTVMRGTEILKKGMGYPVFYDEKLTVTFEDGITEMEIHYKKLKPGE